MDCRPAIVVTLFWPALSLAADVDFNRDVRPILSRHCFKCHGPDEGQREAGVRLDLRDTAIGKADSGAAIIVPGQPTKSELVRRVDSVDPDVVMPPPSANHPLSTAQRRTLREWIAAGADYQPHWSYVAPQRVPLPNIRQSDWPRNAIDRFILARLEREGLSPSPEADHYALIRRVSLDLIGLPPTVEAAEEFAHDSDPNAYERLVDRLLASPQYGERWARRWLDLARYADTNGYEKDRPRSMWPYRDWVIGALNADLPFDQFTIEQFAGDMLPKATLAQRIATGFHRNTMINEEGGIDPLEFRFHAMTDRIGTTGTVWMGLTVACAQCHTHKFDPIQQTDFYRMMAFLNNADEPEMDVPADTIRERQVNLEADVAVREADLPNQFPVPELWKWQSPPVKEAKSIAGAKLTVQSDGSLLASGENPDKDQYIVTLEVPPGEFGALRLETLTDPSLGATGPGRTSHGNFVVTEVSAVLVDAAGTSTPLKFKTATADITQKEFSPAAVLDGKPRTGWAIHVDGKWNVPRSLLLMLAEPLRVTTSTVCVVTLDQQYGSQHTVGKFRWQFGEAVDADASAEVRRKHHFESRYEDWLTTSTANAVDWTPVVPQRWTTTMPKLDVLPDGSMIASGDQTKRDVYDLVFGSELSGATAIRLEVLPDDRLPKRGPGRVYYEGPHGEFFLSELQWDAGEQRLKWTEAVHSFANANNTAAMMIDGSPLTGWGINGGQGRAHVAVLQLAEPAPAANEHTLRMIFERYYAAGLGRFRISYTKAARAKGAAALSPAVEGLLRRPARVRTAEDERVLVAEFCQIAPELESARQAIQKLRGQSPAFPTTLVFHERPTDNPRPTRVHRRGEFLQPMDDVEPGVPAFLPNLPEVTTRDRLAFAQWLVDAKHPLVGRVTVNRHWQAFFGRGLVRTMEDFGYQGELPSHPELLDWLALEVVHHGWSIKELHRLIVTSATYRQSSRVTDALLERDPQNILRARGPRVRLEAEVVRDSLLAMSGLLSTKMNGPSVYPPQPANVTTEGAYGQLAWNVSPGEDRYRRGLYTFTKRTAPFAMFTTFDAPSGEACVPRREVSNTPLQALTLLNDAAFVETAQALGREWALHPGDTPSKLRELFQRCVTRPPLNTELLQLTEFHTRQLSRLTQKELDAEKLAGAGDGDVIQRAAWTIVARALLNLDETITKE